MYTQIYHTKIGKIAITEEDNRIINIDFLKDKNYNIKETYIIRKAFTQISEYLEGKRKQFSIAINPRGTTFQKQVWNALLNIPYGEVFTYKQIAKVVNCPKGYRAIGMANSLNPIMIIIPCHRVINTNGQIGGYAGGIDKKIKLLEIEGIKL